MHRGSDTRRATTRRQFMQRVGLGATALVTSACATRAQDLPSGRRADKRPNFVFILVDDMGWPDPACFGSPFHETPHIDRLAAQGMRFTDAYAACPVCSPTRASILSGQYPARVGITDFIPGHWRPHAKLRAPWNRHQRLPDDVVTLAERLSEEGYTCGSFGKWHLGEPHTMPTDHGFEHAVVTSGWGHFENNSRPDIGLGPDDYLTEVLADLGSDFIAAHRDEPFLLYLSHFAVHIPLEAREELIRKYQEKPKPDSGVNNPVYAAMVEQVDASVGRIMQALEENGLTDDTVVVLYSDNGGLHLRYDGEGEIVSTNAPLRDEKGSLYEGGVRVPCVVRWPGRIAPGSVCDTPITSVDIYPTFLELANAEPASDHVLDGVSLAPLLAGATALPREDIFWHYPHYHHTTPAGAMRSGPWKLIEFFEDGRLELYNLAEDIGESRDVSAQFPETVQALHGRMVAWRDRVGADLPVRNPDYDPEREGEWAPRHPSVEQQR